MQVQVEVVAAQVVGHHAGHAYGNRFALAQALQLDADLAQALAHQQVRNTQVGVAVAPQAQARRRLHLPRGKVDAPVAQGLLQRGLGLEAAPAERDAQR